MSPTGRRIELGSFHSPEEYTGEWRCDLHPRSSPDGRLVSIDSAHRGGRQIYLLDIGGIVGGRSCRGETIGGTHPEEDDQTRKCLNGTLGRK